MNIFVTALLTIVIIGNVALISAIVWTLKKSKDKMARMAGIVLLSHVVINFLAIMGGCILW